MASANVISEENQYRRRQLIIRRNSVSSARNSGGASEKREAYQQYCDETGESEARRLIENNEKATRKIRHERNSLGSEEMAPM